MDNKYDKLVFAFPTEHNEIVAIGDDPDYILSPQAYFRGGTQIPGAKYNCGFQVFVKPFFLDRIPHRHNVEEYLVFMGATFPSLFDFDADIEFSIGKVGVDAEIYHITKPTIIRIPTGLEHCPLHFKRVDKPVFFQAMLQQDMFSIIYDAEDGSQKELRYNGPLPCKRDPGKKCNSCRACIDSE